MASSTLPPFSACGGDDFDEALDFFNGIDHDDLSSDELLSMNDSPPSSPLTTDDGWSSSASSACGSEAEDYSVPEAPPTHHPPSPPTAATRLGMQVPQLGGGTLVVPALPKPLLPTTSSLHVPPVPQSHAAQPAAPTRMMSNGSSAKHQPVVPMAAVMPFMFNMAAMAATMAQQPKQQPLLADDDERPSARARAQAKRKAAERKAKAATETKEDLRRRNRVAADKSRAKRIALLKSLPEEKRALEARVVELEQALAASRAEAGALRDQVAFLKTLTLGQHHSHAPGSAAVTGGSDGTAGGAVADLRTAPSQVMLLAVACVLTVNECGTMAGVFMGGGWGYWGYNADGDGEHARLGGRVLLGVDDEDTDGSRPASSFLPAPVVAPAALALIALLVWHLAALLVVPSLRPPLPTVISLRRAMRAAGLPLWTKDHLN